MYNKQPSDKRNSYVTCECIIKSREKETEYLQPVYCELTDAGYAYWYYPSPLLVSPLPVDT